MSKRLNIELISQNEFFCSCSWYEAATTDTALDISEAIIHTYDELFGGSGADLFTAVKLFEALGGGINGPERMRIVQSRGKDERLDSIPDIQPARSVYDGIVSVTDVGIREARRWENARVIIDLENRKFDFHAHYYTFREEYIEFTERIPDCIPWEELPVVDVGPDIFNGIYFDHVDMVRKIVAQFPNGFRLNNGDVIEWM